MGGENSRPSINDIITTGNAGSLLGEALFRMSELVHKEDDPRPDAWHEIGAALLFGNRVALEVIGRGYYVSGTGSDNSEGTEQIDRITSGFTVRVYRRHGVDIQFVESIRDAHYGSQPGVHQSDGTVSLVYTFLGDSHFGAVEWRTRQLQEGCYPGGGSP